MSRSATANDKGNANAAGPRAAWYVVAFYFKVTAILLMSAILAIYVIIVRPQALFVQARAAGISDIFVWLWVGLAIPFCSYIGIDTFLYTRWLRGYGKHEKPILEFKMDSRFKPVTFSIGFGILGIALIGMGIEAVLGAPGNPFFSVTVIPLGLFCLFDALCYYLWSRDVVHNAE